MMGRLKKGFATASIVMVLLALTIVSVGAAIQSHTYRLKDSTEYMDKTYVFRLERQEDNSYVNGFCAEYSAPTFDGKRGLIDWVDFRVYPLEDKFDNEKAGRIRSIMTKAGPHLEPTELVTDLQESLGIMDVEYEQVVSAVQYAVWYYTDELMIVPSSENGYDIYKYLISLPPSYSDANTDLIRLNMMNRALNPQTQKLVFEYQYDSSGQDTQTGHQYSKDIVAVYGAVESIIKQNDITTVTITIPVTSTDVAIDFDVTVNGSRSSYGDVYAYAPDEQGSVQAMVAYASYDTFSQLDTKNLDLTYTAHGLRVDNDGRTVIQSYEEGQTVGLSEIEELNPSGKSGFTFAGWYYYGTDTQVMNNGVYMDGPKHIVARYSRTTDPDDNNGGGNPDDNDPDGNNPDDNDPDGNNPDDNEPDETIDDDTIPESNPDDPFGLNPDDSSPNDPVNPSDGDEPVDIPDEDTPKSVPEDFEPPYAPEGYKGDSELFYYINRFAESGGVPFLIFFLLGVLALLIGFLIKHQQKKEQEEALLDDDMLIADGEVIRLSKSKSLMPKHYNDNPFGDDDYE